MMRRCVVPLFTNTDSDSDSLLEIVPADAEETSSDESSTNESGFQAESIDRRAGVRPAESLSDSENTGAKTKREKFDSGVGDLAESASGGSSHESPSTEQTDRSPTDNGNSREVEVRIYS